MKTLILTFLTSLIQIYLFANVPPIAIKGQIRMGDEAVPFATINYKGTTVGTVADADGCFTINQLPTGNMVLQVQAVGYKTLEMPIGPESNTSITIEMVEDRIGLNEVVVTANRYEVSRQQSPIIVNVLNAGLLQASNAMCIADGLNFQPGIRVENNCQNCGFQQVRINGLEGPYSQILIDSRPIFSALSGVYGIEQIPVAMIEKVEVVRGGGSALYGSNAIAGTVNIITKEPVNNSIEAGYNLTVIGETALDHNLSAQGTFVSPDRKAGLSLFAVHRNREPYDANGDGFSELGLIDGKAVGLRSYYKPSSFSKLTATYHYLGEFRRGGNKFDLKPHETDITEQTDHQIHGGELIFDLYSKSLKSKLSFYTALQHIDRKSYYGAQQDLNAYGRTFDLSYVSGAQFNYRFNKLLFAPANLTAGAEYQHNNLKDNMPGYNRELRQLINIGGFFVQGDWRFNRASLILGARADKHNLINKLIYSPRATLLYDLTAQLQWRGSYSTGFRAPQSFDEDLHIIAVNGGVMLIQLDPDLRPEYSKSFSTSLDSYYNVGNKENNLMVEGFYTRLDDVFVLETLETDAQGNMRVERRNGSGAVVQGFNIENKTVLSRKLQMQLGLTLQKSQYAKPEEWSDDPEAALLKSLPKSPNVYGYFSMTASPTKRFNTYLTGTYTGTMKVPHFKGYIAADALKTTPAFLDINLKCSFEFKIRQQTKLQVEAGVQNIFNSYQSDFDVGAYRDAGYIYGPMKPRSFFLGIKIVS